MGEGLAVMHYVRDQMDHFRPKFRKELINITLNLFKRVFKCGNLITYLMYFFAFLESSLLKVVVYDGIFQCSTIILDDQIRNATLRE